MQVGSPPAFTLIVKPLRKMEILMKIPVLTVASESDFDRALAQSARAVLVKVGNNTRCPPCLAVEPVMHKIASDFAPHLTVIEVDSDLKENAFVHSRFKFQGIPHFFFFIDGNEHSRQAGFGDYATLRTWFYECVKVAAIPLPDRAYAESRFAALAAELWQTYDSTVADVRTRWREANAEPSAALQAVKTAAGRELSDSIIDQAAHDAAIKTAQETYQAVMKAVTDEFQAVNKPAYATYTASLKAAVETYLFAPSTQGSVDPVVEGAACAIGDPTCRS